jgi:hypothetical protein
MVQSNDEFGKEIILMFTLMYFKGVKLSIITNMKTIFEYCFNVKYSKLHWLYILELINLVICQRIVSIFNSVRYFKQRFQLY